jgi:hypothetical protein
MLTLHHIINNNYPFRNCKFNRELNDSEFVINVSKSDIKQFSHGINPDTMKKSQEENENILHTNYLEDSQDQLKNTFFGSELQTFTTGLNINLDNIPYEAKESTNNLIHYIRTNFNEYSNLQLCIMNDIEYTIDINYSDNYHSMMFQKIQEEEQKQNEDENTNNYNTYTYPVFLLLQKENKYTYYYYPTHTLSKVQKVWLPLGYNRINIQEHWDKTKSKCRKMDMLRFIRGKDYEKDITKSWKKERLFMEICIRDLSL